MASFGEGDAGKDLIWVIGFIVVLGVVWIIMGGPASFKSDGAPSRFFNPPDIIPKSASTSGSQKKTTNPKTTTSVSKTTTTIKAPVVEKVDPTVSQYDGQVTISLGRSGDSVSTTNQEYVTLTASSRNKVPINISGWKIDNGKSGKYYDVYGKMVQGHSTQASIPFGTTLLSGISKSSLVVMRLSPGGKAYIVTGRMPNTSPYTIDASFLVNKCSGYLEALPNYKFTPTLSGSCPSYKTDVNTAVLSSSCLSIVDNYGTNCHTPVISQDEELGEVVDKKVIPSDCKKIILSTFNYSSCIARHSSDTDFYKKNWYVYLNYSGFPLYASSRATITLYDNLGKVVDTYSY